MFPAQKLCDEGTTPYPHHHLGARGADARAPDDARLVADEGDVVAVEDAVRWFRSWTEMRRAGRDARGRAVDAAQTTSPASFERSPRRPLGERLFLDGVRYRAREHRPREARRALARRSRSNDATGCVSGGKHASASGALDANAARSSSNRARARGTPLEPSQTRRVSFSSRAASPRLFAPCRGFASSARLASSSETRGSIEARDRRRSGRRVAATANAPRARVAEIGGAAKKSTKASKATRAARARARRLVVSVSVLCKRSSFLTRRLYSKLQL